MILIKLTVVEQIILWLSLISIISSHFKYLNSIISKETVNYMHSKRTTIFKVLELKHKLEQALNLIKFLCTDTQIKTPESVGVFSRKD